MNEIKILFYLLGTFFNGETPPIAASKATVEINPVAQTITITQEGLYAMIFDENSGRAVRGKMKDIMENTGWREELADYPVATCELLEGSDGTLHARIQLTYRTVSDLEAYGLTDSGEGYFYFFNFPDDQLHTDDGTLDGNYWHFDTDKPFTFTLDPADKMPERYRPYKTDLLSLWKEMKSP